jgi:GT2 family glycosyltransferase
MRTSGATIAVPTLDRTDCLIDTLDDLRAQSLTPIEILVIDQSSDPDSRVLHYVKQHDGIIRYFNVPFKGLPEARNYAWQMAKYPIIIYVDDDIRCGKDFAEKHLETYADEATGAVAGGIDEKNGDHYGNKRKAAYNAWTATGSRAYYLTGIFEADHVPGGNFSVKKSAVKLAGGFDERLNYGAALYEETEFSLRLRKAGIKIMFNGNARITHLAVQNGGCRVRDMGRYVDALVHNRCVLIFRYSKWYQIPVAIIRLCVLVISYARAYKNMRMLWNMPRRMHEGIQDAYKIPLLTQAASCNQ